MVQAACLAAWVAGVNKTYKEKGKKYKISNKACG